MAWAGLVVLRQLQVAQMLAAEFGPWAVVQTVLGAVLLAVDVAWVVLAVGLG